MALIQDHEHYAPYDLDFGSTLYMLLSLKAIYARLPFANSDFSVGEEVDELAGFLEGLEGANVLQAMHDVACVFVRDGTNGSVKLPANTELGKSMSKLLDPVNKDRFPAGFDPTGRDLENPDFISSLLATAAKFFRTAIPGLVGMDSEVSVKPGLCGLQLPDLGDEVLVFARRKEAEKYKEELSFPTKLVALEKTGWMEI